MPKKTAEEKRKAAAERKAKAAARKLAREAKKQGVTVEELQSKVEKAKILEDAKKGPEVADVIKQASVTGVLSSRPDSRDIEISHFSISLYGKELVSDATLKLNFGRRYGLIGQNGSGKSTLLWAIASGEIPIPDHCDIWHLHTEAKPSEQTAFEAVKNIVLEKVQRLEKRMEVLLEEDPENPVIEAIMNDIDFLDVVTLDARTGELLFGLGFKPEMMHKKTKDMSGGWRMRVALAQALLVQPTLLLLDEPTNHLDLGACIWLEDYLSRYPKILLVISHSADFLNTVCTNIMELNQDQVLEYYGGNYETYCRTREELRVNQLKRYKKEQEDIAKLLNFIRTCGTYSNLVKQAQSKQKIIDKMREAGLTPKPKPDPTYSFKFPACAKLPPPVMSFKEVSFSYSGKKEDYLYSGLDFGVDLDSRICLVGPNGVGKSTLLKLMIGELEPTEGDVSRHGHLRIAYYNQHSEAQLDMDLSPLQFLPKFFPQGVVLSGSDRIQPEVEQWRQVLGKYGVTGSRQTDPIRTLSDGLKTRVVFCMMGLQNPHILLLDEPTNHLDMDCINSLAGAINAFPGGMVLVSHDFRLLSQVAEEIWVCDNKSITKWKDAGGIASYKERLRQDGEKALRNYQKTFGK